MFKKYIYIKKAESVWKKFHLVRQSILQKFLNNNSFKSLNVFCTSDMPSVLHSLSHFNFSSRTEIMKSYSHLKMQNLSLRLKNMFQATKQIKVKVKMVTQDNSFCNSCHSRISHIIVRYIKFK